MYDDSSPSLNPPEKTPGTTPHPWQVRAWCEQAKRLYRSPEAQRMALVHHLTLKQHWTRSPEVWLWCESIASALHEVAP